MVGAVAMIRTSAYAFAICAVYSVWFAAYTPRGPRRSELWQLVLRTVLVVGGILLYAGFEQPSKVEYRFGLVVTGLTLGYIGLPLLKLVSYGCKYQGQNGRGFKTICIFLLKNTKGQKCCWHECFPWYSILELQKRTFFKDIYLKVQFFKNKLLRKK